MCAFHHSLQTGSLFEREGRWDRGYAFHGWQFHLCRGRKIQKFRSFSIEELGEVGKVVLTRLVTRKAIGMRFEEGWSWFLVWKRLGKRKISCFWGGHRLWCTCFWKFMKALKGSNKDSARPVGKQVTRNEFIEILGGWLKAVQSTVSYKPFSQGNDKIETAPET